MKVATGVYAWEITDHKEVDGQTRNILYLPESQMQVTAGEMASVMKVRGSLKGCDVKEEQEQKILLSIEQNSLKPVREKHSGVWGR